MFVKALTMKGFKSFADPTTFDLLQGVNVVVGPNGSGKSNVIDAVAWVLGAQGARALRGGKMDDVIFAGTSKRQALGRAEVTLVLDNSDHKVPIEFSEVSITRTLFRTGESEYAINGVPCRLLDIQELLSDSGVGRQQHVIVSQGNLDAVLNARPEDRRMIIEEAAGVLKYRKRREKSQRRLEATEQNLERISDLVREVRSQMRPLQRQAQAALRYEAVAEELRALKLFTVARDIDALMHRIANADADYAQSADRDAALQQEITHLDEEVTRREARMERAQHNNADEAVERLEVLRQRAKGLYAVMNERSKTLQSELHAQVNQDVVAQLHEDADTSRAEMSHINDELQQLALPESELVADEEEQQGRWADFEAEWGAGLPMITDEVAEQRGEAASLQRAIDALHSELDQRNRRVTRLQEQLDNEEQEVQRFRNASESLEAAKAEFTTALEAALQELAASQETCDAQEDALRQAEQHATVASARAETLQSALDATRARTGVEQLGELKGIVGTLSDLVEIDEGYVSAFEAAVGQAMAAVIVRSPDVARRGIAHCARAADTGARAASSGARAEFAGAFLALGETHAHVCAFPDMPHVKPVRSVVRAASDDVNTLLDRLLCCCGVVDGEWTAAADAAIAHPDLIFVTTSGDRFSRNGWSVGSASTGATRAAVERAQDEVVRCASVREEAAAQFSALREQHALHADAAKNVRRDIDENEKALTAAQTGLQRSMHRSESLRAELETIDTNLDELAARMQEYQQKLNAIAAVLPGLEANHASAEARAQMWHRQREQLEALGNEIAERRRALQSQKESLQSRHMYLQNRVVSLEERLAQMEQQSRDATERHGRLRASLHALELLRAHTMERLHVIENLLEMARNAREAYRRHFHDATEQLEVARRRRSQAERELLNSSQQRQEHEVRQTELRMRLQALEEVLRDELETDLATARSVDEPQLEGSQTPKQRITELDRELRQIGPINALAVEEFREVEERYAFLDQQLQDVQSSRRELVRVIRAVDAEIVEVFRSAFEDVAAHFTSLLAALFPGGSGRLRLTDPEQLSETGIEIDAKPSGKNVRSLSLLSGGERSLVAMAFLFAVFRSRPSPFYLLDEVEAALDDVNLTRFLQLIQEFRGEAQLVIVSHQKRTMESADCLYGVSMQPGGVSKVISERVEVDLRERLSNGSRLSSAPDVSSEKVDV